LTATGFAARCSPAAAIARFETADPKYAFLNRLLAVGAGEIQSYDTNSRSTGSRRSSRAPVGAAGGIDVGAAKPFVFPTELRMALLDGGDAVVAWLKQQDPALSTEDVFNGFGYWILDLEHPREAIPIFAWVTERFPKSWNAFDSLGDAYRRAGDRARTIESYERSLVLNPKNPNLVKRLAQVRETPVRTK
jgi:tetratricopeptide (TPR) repeat protein